MAEHFHRGRVRVTFSNGAVEALYAALIVLGERSELPRTAAGRAVVDWLRDSLHSGAAGGRAFDLDPVEPELADPDRLRMLATLVGELAHAIAVESPDPAVIDVVWDRELRLSWLARIEVLHEMIADALGPEGGCAPLVIELDAETGAEVDAERWLWSYRHVKAAGVVAETIAHIDRTLALLASAKAMQRRAHAVYSLMSDKADLLAKSGRRREAAKVLCEAVHFTDDAALTEATLDLARQLERDP
ncbi:MAG TPA: hypothetical protein VFG69_20880 [Nannocystaceae bacterium]|nr:hypothetical protein [Nannocystaceae bacterium]